MAGNLLELAKQKFGRLTVAEEQFFHGVAEGRFPDFSSQQAAENEPAMAKSWPAGRAIHADRITWLATDPEASRLVTHRGIGMKGARIDGRLDLQAANIEFALYFDKCALPDGINLLGAEIHALNLSGTHVGRISADGMKVESGVFLRAGFTATGRVRLLGAEIGGNLDCEGGRFLGPAGESLAADGIKVNGSVAFNNGFRADGQVRLIGAIIGGNLSCDAGKFTNPGQTALLADRIKIEGNVFLNDGFQAQGKVALPSAIISGFFLWQRVASPQEASLDLRSARIGTLWISQESWPTPGNLLLHGLVYDQLDDESHIDSDTRIAWLRLQPTQPFRPQPYEQMAAVLRRDGQEADAKLVLYAKEVDRARNTKLTWSELPWYRVFGPMIGYGYKPWRAFWAALSIILLGTMLFEIGSRSGLMTPAKAEGLVIVPGKESKVAEFYPRLHAFMYSLDTFTPLISLDQAEFWLPNANAGRSISFLLFSVTTGELLRWYMWFHIIAGWILSTLLFVGLTGSIPGA